jgi:glycosyltransferase involved in cell wall biosynthesis
MYEGHTVSVVIPCLNEEKGIAYLLGAMPQVVDEVVVVDNRSTDRTAETARRLGARVVFEPLRGYGRAYARGLAEAKGEIIVAMDGDGTYPPQAIVLLLYILLAEDVDFVSAMRWYSRTGERKSRLRLLGNFILSLAIRILFLRRIYDTQSGMWVFRRGVLARLRPSSTGMAFSEEIKIGAFTDPSIRAIEIPIYYGARIGTSKLSLWRDGFENLLFIVKKRFQMRAGGSRRGRAHDEDTAPR